MIIPDEIMNMINNAYQNYIWDNERIVDPETYGDEVKVHRWIKNDAQYNSRVWELGLGVLPWMNHVKAIQIRWLLRYLDATTGEYKVVLDQWLARSSIGKGAIFSTLPIVELTKSTTHSKSHLPKFWRRALTVLREVGLNRLVPNTCSTPDEARAMPFWWCPLFTVTNAKHALQWRDNVHLNTIKDTFTSTNTEYSDNEIKVELLAAFKSRDNTWVRVAHNLVPIKSLLKQWNTFIDSIPDYINMWARDMMPVPAHLYSQTAQELMQQQGWMPGDRLGHGPANPIEAPANSSTAREGLGYARPRKNNSQS